MKFSRQPKKATCPMTECWSTTTSSINISRRRGGTNKIDREFVSLATNIYRDSTTRVFVGEALTDPISINCGVKQGCPLSGILFNLAINQVLVSVQEGREGKAILAFADDLVLLAKSAEDLQTLLNITIDELDKLTLRVNTNKCAMLHISGETETGARKTRSHIALKILGDGDYYKYLGKPVGFFLMKNFKTVNEALSLLQKVATSNLAPWQKLDAWSLEGNGSAEIVENRMKHSLTRKSYTEAWQMRHNAIVRRIKTAVAYKGTILSENQTVGHSTAFRPDLDATFGNSLYIDITVPFKDRRDTFAAAAQRKLNTLR
ncbi:reverse transcriptase, putative [Trichonephila inaurata madagascariensis]|uniref:Reverse transcriptase, putative n=1 Tax=Trichonephila inaurata madagascariensis TaxID=2747483 RepID=A0A8X6M9T3_9ARAC|nr:reverse transcriptase, putative [Trichonephila inaurata madagascariensis]